MLTPILMILILTAPYVAIRLMRNGRGGESRTTAAAALGAGLLFLFTASGHFIQTEAMSQMLPPWVPGRTFLVYLTGFVEIAVAIAFFFARWRVAAGWAAIVLLVAFFPANVYAALERVGLGGHVWGPVYLLVRGPLQLFIVAWIWALVVRRGQHRLPSLASAVRH